MKKSIIYSILGVLVIGLFFIFSNSEGDKNIRKEDHITRSIQENSLYSGMKGSYNMSEDDIRKLAAPSQEAKNLAQKAYSMYPPNSRPLRKSMKDLIYPFQLQTSEIPIKLKKADKPEDQKDIVYQFSGPKYFITGDEEFVAYLKIFRHSTQEIVTSEIQKAEVVSDIKTGRQKLNPPEYNDNGTGKDKQSGDGIITFSWRPGSNTRIYWGQLALKVQFKVEDKIVNSKLQFFSTPQVPAIFTGNFQENIVNGSLEIKAELNVKKSGHYIIEANLFHEGTDEPIHWVYYNGQLKSGMRDIPLLFYGKIFHDVGLEGQYVLKDLRGYRNNVPFNIDDMAKIAEGEINVEENDEPHREFIRSMVSEYTTKKYSLKDFSNQSLSSEN